MQNLDLSIIIITLFKDPLPIHQIVLQQTIDKFKQGYEI
jgi:hypothetical protein